MGIVVIVLGLCIGSFLGAYTYRKPKGISVYSGRSFCPSCKTRISWFDNIPLLSFILLVGKCRSCGKKISLRYPLIEASTTLLFLAFFSHFGFPAIAFFGVLISVLVAIFVIDLENRIIPDELVFFGLLFILFFYLFSGPDLIFKNLFSGFATSLFFLHLNLLTRGRGMGLGDVKFVILGGLLLGWPKTAIWLFLSFASGAVTGVILLLLKKTKFGREIAFGPFLATALLFTVIYGEKILGWYLKTN